MKDKQNAVIISTTIGVILFGATYYFFIEKPKQDAQNAAPGNTSPGIPSASGNPSPTPSANDPKQIAIAYLKGYLNPSNELLAYMNSLATAFLQAWVTGLKNNQMGFYYGGDYYSIQTGKKV